MSRTKSKRPARLPSAFATFINSSRRNRPSVRFFTSPGKVQLRGQHASARRLDLQVIMTRAALVRGRHDGEKAIAALRVGELVAAQAEARIVVLTLGVRMPDVHQRPLERAAAAREHEASQLDRLALEPRLAQIGPLGRAWLEERPLGLPARSAASPSSHAGVGASSRCPNARSTIPAFSPPAVAASVPASSNRRRVG